MIDSEKPSAVLKTEHRVILRVLGVLDRLVARSASGQGFEAASLRQCVEFFRFFADACHHAKEEDLLFPLLESRGIPRDGGPIGVMLHEHQLARRYTAEMGEALDSVERKEADAEERLRKAAGSYSELLVNHIHKEDTVLFNMGDQVMTGDDQNALCSKFCEVACKSFGGKKREQLELMADELEAQWPDS